MWTRHTFGKLLKQRLHDLLELCWLNDVKYLLKLVQIHHLTVSATSSLIYVTRSVSKLVYKK